MKIVLPKEYYFYNNSKFPHADWLVAIVYKSTDNKNDVKCKARAFSTENKTNSAHNFSLLL